MLETSVLLSVCMEKFDPLINLYDTKLLCTVLCSRLFFFLFQEQDMPLEELLALYGYSDKDNPEADVPLDEIKPDPLPPLIEASEMDLPQPSNPLIEENILQQNAESPAPPSPDSPLSEPSSVSPRSPPSPRASRDNNFFPENQRITRGCE